MLVDSTFWDVTSEWLLNQTPFADSVAETKNKQKLKKTLTIFKTKPPLYFESPR